MDSTAGPYATYPITAAETAAGVVPSNMMVPSHLQAGGCYLERYGGGIGAAAATNDTAFASAILVSGQLDLPIFISPGAGSWNFSAPWVMTGTGQSQALVGPPVGGAGVTGCRVIGVGGSPVIKFNTIGATTDLITLGSNNVPQLEFRNLQINCNTTGRDGVVILGANEPIFDNVIIYNSTRDAFVLSPNGTAAQWIEKGRFILRVRNAGRHGVLFNLLGNAGSIPFVNECYWLLEVRGVSAITAGGNAIAMTAAAGLAAAGKVADQLFARTVLDAIYNTAGIVPDTSPVKIYSGVAQNWIFNIAAWENTGTGGLVGGAGTWYNVSTNGGAGTMSGLSMMTSLTNSFWSNSGPDPLCAAQFVMDYSYSDVRLQGPLTLAAPISAAIGQTTKGISGSIVASFVSASATAANNIDVQVTRNGSATNTLAGGPNIELFDSTNTLGTIIQHGLGQTEIWQYNGSWVQVLVITGALDFLARGIAVCKRATAIETRTSTTTLTNSTQLTYAIPKVGTYAFELLVFSYFTTATTNGITANVNYSGTFTAVGSYLTGISLNGSTTDVGIQPVQVSATVNNALAGLTLATYGASVTSAAPAVHRIAGTLIATGTGTLAFAFAQASSGVNTANLGVGSYLKVTQLS